MNTGRFKTGRGDHFIAPLCPYVQRVSAVEVGL